METSKNHLIRNFLRNGRGRVKLSLLGPRYDRKEKKTKFRVWHFFVKNGLENMKFLNPQAPVAQKVADEVVFRRFRGEGVEFFKIGPH